MPKLISDTYNSDISRGSNKSKDTLPIKALFAISLRDLRGSLTKFRLFLICLTLGVAVIAGVASVSESIQSSIDRQAKSILGGDLALRLTARPVTPDQLDFLRQLGQISQVVELRSIARDPNSDRRSLVELKPVDPAYPLYGEVTLRSGQDLQDILADQQPLPAAVVEQEFLEKVNLQIGDEITLGQGRFQIRDVITSEPDRAVTAFSFGPRVMISQSAAKETGLLQEGTLSRFLYRIKLLESASLEETLERLEAQYPSPSWQVRTYLSPAPGMERFVERIGTFLILVGLSTLLIGGIGIANAVRSYLQTKLESIASMKAMGATAESVFTIYFLQIVMMTALAVVLGLIAGSLFPYAVEGFFGTLFPFDLMIGLYAKPLALAAAFGLLISLVFSFVPLARAVQVSPASLFRNVVNFPEGALSWRQNFWLGLLGTAMITLVFLSSTRLDLAIGFLITTALTFGLFRVLGALTVWTSRQAVKGRRGKLRLALANIHRPGNQTTNLLLSIGVGLSLIGAIQLVDANFRASLSSQLPEEAPGYFFIDIQPNQVAEFDRIVTSVDGVDGLQRVPSLRGRLVKVDGVPVDQIDIDEDVGWVIESDRGVSYATTLPENAEIASGEWWPADYTGPLLVSLDQRIIDGFGTQLGGTVTMNVMGRDITAKIASGRDINWRTFGVNFTFVFSPGVLQAAPHTHIATITGDEAAQQRAARLVNEALPNVSPIRVKEALEEANGIIRSVSSASGAIGILSLIAGAFVLAGAMIATHQRRLREAVVLKVLGATRRDILTTQLLEYLVIVGICLALSIALAGALSFLFVANIFVIEWQMAWSALWMPMGLSVLVVFLFALISTAHILRQKPGPLLRDQ